MRKSIVEIAGFDPHAPEILWASEATEKYARLMDRLVRRRKAAKLSQSDVADRMGTKQSAVSDLERSGANPRVRTLLRYARAVGVDLTFQTRDVQLSSPYTVKTTYSAVDTDPSDIQRAAFSVSTRPLGRIAC
jgi:transcriptional regulator with XRE-family HTH domain